MKKSWRERKHTTTWKHISILDENGNLENIFLLDRHGNLATKLPRQPRRMINPPPVQEPKKLRRRAKMIATPEELNSIAQLTYSSLHNLVSNEKDRTLTNMNNQNMIFYQNNKLTTKNQQKNENFVCEKSLENSSEIFETFTENTEIVEADTLFNLNDEFFVEKNNEKSQFNKIQCEIEQSKRLVKELSASMDLDIHLNLKMEKEFPSFESFILIDGNETNVSISCDDFVGTAAAAVSLSSEEDEDYTSFDSIVNQLPIIY
ncbi:hypothetical protein TRFO_19862 [Tritrichomonas foetus]|uniref:Uncharacterized protein n=1 Tax=Tritrichomonas foetus TaxID=1144522 RepID=A0A1J4KHW8_9EUKA|nr:hypothetical protein TRFO_19862 [Tritrichomonas foetus]|eukprot:OHT10803.1 hypothetical protein TRFO_19862 [Tritrichomonas foetus]